MSFVLIGLADIVEMVAVELEEDGKHRGWRGHGSAKITLGDSGPFELIIMCLGLGLGEYGKQPSALIGGIFRLCVLLFSNFHGLFLSVPIENELRQGEPGVVQQCRSTVACHIDAQAVQHGMQQGE